MPTTHCCTCGSIHDDKYTFHHGSFSENDHKKTKVTSVFVVPTTKTNKKNKQNNNNDNTKKKTDAKTSLGWLMVLYGFR